MASSSASQSSAGDLSRPVSLLFDRQFDRFEYALLVTLKKQQKEEKKQKQNQKQQQQQQQQQQQSESSSAFSPAVVHQPLQNENTDTISSSPAKRGVTFSNLHIREFEVTIGDHPMCKDALPLSLNWAHCDYPMKIGVELYEKARRKGHYKRRSDGPRLLDYMERMTLLERVCGKSVSRLLMDAGAFSVTQQQPRSKKRCRDGEPRPVSSSNSLSAAQTPLLLSTITTPSPQIPSNEPRIELPVEYPDLTYLKDFPMIMEGVIAAVETYEAHTLTGSKARKLWIASAKCLFENCAHNYQIWPEDKIAKRMLKLTINTWAFIDQHKTNSTSNNQNNDSGQMSALLKLSTNQKRIFEAVTGKVVQPWTDRRSSRAMARAIRNATTSATVTQSPQSGPAPLQSNSSSMN
mmetsp:Transcript_22096/g.33997  ORF Transcript_22096/g.33997 Transcript_22096/m.33997 type:complete len:406 (+) Transcript_22096:137-1354(+)